MMSKSIEMLAPRLVAADSHHLAYIDDLIQDVSNDAEHLAMALLTVEAKDDASKGVLVAVRAALLANSQHASKVSEMLGDIIALPAMGEWQP